MSGAIQPLPRYVFMAWCSVKKTQGQLYLYIYKVSDYDEEKKRKLPSQTRNIHIVDYKLKID
jgi:hypothetical protein